MPWLQVHVTLGGEQARLGELLLEQLGALSITHADAAADPLYEPPLGATPLWASTRVSGLFPAEQDPDSLRTNLQRRLTSDHQAIDISVLEDRHWERAWMDRFEPMRFGRRLWVCPQHRVVPQADAVVVSMDPGLAFGTGTHPTTALCLGWLDRTPLEGRTLIDFGCGSGILGIAAACLGAAKVVALDHDPQAVTATRQNALRNAIADRIDVRLSTDNPIPCGDIVVANILANILIERRDCLLSAIDIGGAIALSGILATQVDAVRLRFDHAIEFDPPILQEDWALLTGKRHR